MNREVFATHSGPAANRGEMPTVTVEEALLFTDPARAGSTWCFISSTSNIDQGSNKWDVLPLDLPASRLARSLAGGAAMSAGTAATEQPDHRARSLASATMPRSTGSPRPSCWPRCAPAPRTPRTCTRARNRDDEPPFAAITDFRDIVVDQLPRRCRRGRAGADGVLAALRTMGRETPHPGAVGRVAARRLQHRYPWLPVNPNHVEINAADQWADPGSCAPLPGGDLVAPQRDHRSARDFTMLLADDPGSTPSPAGGRGGVVGMATSPMRRPRSSCPTSSNGTAPSWCWQPGCGDRTPPRHRCGRGRPGSAPVRAERANRQRQARASGLCLITYRSSLVACRG